MDMHDGVVTAIARRWMRRALVTVFGALIAFWWLAAGAPDPAMAQLPPSLTYEIVTHTGDGGACDAASARNVRDATYAQPMFVDVGGTSAPDLEVELVPAAAGDTSGFVITVKRLGLPTTPLPVKVEAVVTLDAASGRRLAFGYDACDATAPVLFRATATSRPERMTVDTQMDGAGATLQVIAETFRASGPDRVDPTKVAARLTPVPRTAAVAVDVLGSSAYKAHVEVAVPTLVHVAYSQQSPGRSVSASATVDRLPASVDVTFGPSQIVWDAPDGTLPLGLIDVAVDTATQGASSRRVGVRLEGVPSDVTVRRVGTTGVDVDASAPIGATTVRYAAFDAGATLPAPPTAATAYVHASRRDGVDVVDVRVLGLRSLNADTGDVVGVDLLHAGGPLDVSVVEDTRRAVATVRDLPADVELWYDRAANVLTYAGSDEIKSLTVELTSTKPIAARANRLHLVLYDVPRKVTATLDRDAQTFDLTIPAGRLGSAELTLTNGPAERLPGGTDGLLLVDLANPISTPPPPDAPYEVVVRVSKVARAWVGWGSPAFAELVHDAAPFHLSLRTFEQTVTGVLENLPADMRVTYDKATVEKPSTFTYRGSEDIGLVTIDVVHRDAAAKRLHVVATGVPTGITLVNDTRGQRVTADMPEGDLDLLEVLATTNDSVCTPKTCLPEGTNGVRVEDRLLVDDTVERPADLDFVRLAGLRHAEVAMGEPVLIDLVAAGGPLDLTVVQEGVSTSPDRIRSRLTAEGRLRDLPPEVRITYSRQTQDFTYHGSAPIAQLTLDVVGEGRTVAGDATRMEVDARGITTDLKLHLTSGDPGNFIVALEAPSGPIQRIDALLTNVAEQDITADDILPEHLDGALRVQRDDPPGVIDSYRVRNLRSFRVEAAQFTAPAPDDDEEGDVTAIILDARIEDPRTLRYETRTPNKTKPGGYEYFRVDYGQPAPVLHLELETHDDSDGEFAYLDADYAGSTLAGQPHTGGELVLTTNRGEARTSMEASITPVPATLTACIAPGFGVCSRWDNTDHDDDQSYAVTVSEPITLTLRDCVESASPFHPSPPQDVSLDCNWADAPDNYMATRTTGQFTIEQHLTAMVENVDEVVADVNLHMDTRNRAFNGALTRTSRFFDPHLGTRSNRGLWVNIPEGFRADDRFVAVDCDTDLCNPRYIHGTVVCPGGDPGTKIVKDTPVGEVNVADEFCTGGDEPPPPPPPPAALCDGRNPTVTGSGTLSGTDGDDVIMGSDGPDVIDGRGGNDVICGLAGDDIFVGGAVADGADRFIGGDGTDTVSYADRPDPVTVGVGTTGSDGAAGEGDNVEVDVEVVIGGSGSDRLEGAVAATVPVRLEGRAGNDYLAGTAADDVLLGGAGHDQLRGRLGNDAVFGESGQDHLAGEASVNGADVLDGGEDRDVAMYAERTEALELSLDDTANDGAAGEGDNIVAVEWVFGGAGNDKIVGSAGWNRLGGGPGDDHVVGADGTDTLVGGSVRDGADVMEGGAGVDYALYSDRSERVELSLDGVANDGAVNEGDNLVGLEVLFSGAGNDRLVGDAGNNTLDGGRGHDELLGREGHDLLLASVAGDGTDVFDGGPGTDYGIYTSRTAAVRLSLDAAANDGEAGEGDNLIGIEYLHGGAGPDTIVGDEKSNLLSGHGGDDELVSGGGPDYLEGGTGNDVLFGGADQDRMFGGPGDDTLHGEGGGDLLLADPTADGADVFDGGEGADVAGYGLRTQPVALSLDGAANDGGHNESDNLVGIEHLHGGAGADTLVGDAGNNRFDAGDGDDRITGGAGRDDARGDGGNDTLDVADGVSGNDTADGGAGTDTATADTGDRIMNVP